MQGKYLYEYAIIHPNEKIEIVVTDGLFNEIDRFNIIRLLNPISELPAEKCALFNIQTY